MFRNFFALLNIIFLNLLLSLSIYSQNDSNRKIVFTVDFKFNDGVYLDFLQVKNNHPILKSRFVSSTDISDNHFFDLLLAEKQIVFFDDFGTRQTVDVKTIWGYSRNGMLFIRMFDNFNRISYVGNICHFIANVTLNNRSYDPYFYSPYNTNQRMMNSSGPSSIEMKQFLLDFESGKVYDYDEKNIGILLMKDPTLYDEFSALKKRKQQQLKFFFIRKFNEHHPLMLPE